MLYAATGIRELDVNLKQAIHAEIVYYAKGLLELCASGDAAVVSPKLQCDEMHIIDVITELRAKDVRVIMLYGDDQELARRCVSLGVYDLIPDPVAVLDILKCIESPAKFSDIPVEFRPQGLYPVPMENAPAEENTFFKKVLDMLKQSVFKQSSRTKNRRHGIFFHGGIIKNRKLQEGNWKSVIDMLDERCDAVVIPSSWDEKDVKKFHRDSRSRTVPLVAVGRKKPKFKADRHIKKITPEVLEEITMLAEKLRELWASAETDSLTGLYTRKFADNWMSEQSRRSMNFSVALLDIDKFKSINDTWGHGAGDEVLKEFGNFLKNTVRESDVVSRYGGEEFLVCLPDTSEEEAYVLIDRLRKKWESRTIYLPSGETIKCTFSAGVAQGGKDAVEKADQRLYRAKKAGRNQVRKTEISRVLLLGNIDTALVKSQGLEITYDPKQADAVIADRENIRYAPENLPLCVLGTGSVADWLIKKQNPDAVVCLTVEEAVGRFKTWKEPNNLAVLPGARTGEKNQTIPQSGVLYVVCPSRPADAGRIAAEICCSVENSALVCAVGESVGALEIGIPEKTLIISDWRIPGAKAPVVHKGVTVWPVDVCKHIKTTDNVLNLIDQIKYRFSLVVVDCGGSLSVCSRIAGDEGVLLIHRKGDSSDRSVQIWLKSYGGHNVSIISPSEVPAVIKAENGFVFQYD